MQHALRLATPEDQEVLRDFNLAMARKSEDRTADPTVLAAVPGDPAKGFHPMAETEPPAQRRDCQRPPVGPPTPGSPARASSKRAFKAPSPSLNCTPTPAG